MKKITKLIAFVLVLVLGVILVACGNKGGGDNTATTVNELTAESGEKEEVNELTAESGVSASGTFENGSALKAELHAADSKQGKAAISAIDKPYDSARVAVFDITLTKGGEKVLIYNTIGEIVPEGKLPLDVGAIVLNCTTLANIARYCRTGMPLVEKCITVDGSAVAKPKNVIVPIGMKLADVYEQSGGFCAEPKKVLYGGPMMGIAVPDLEQPVLKNTNAILAMTEADAVLPEPSACIRCGRCIRHCPLRLMPSHIVAAYEAGNMERLAELKVNLCMECGCCSFGCPAHRPLVQTNKLAKAKLAAWRKLQSEKIDAKKEAVQK